MENRTKILGWLGIVLVACSVNAILIALGDLVLRGKQDWHSYVFFMSGPILGLCVGFVVKSLFIFSTIDKRMSDLESWYHELTREVWEHKGRLSVLTPNDIKQEADKIMIQIDKYVEEVKFGIKERRNFSPRIRKIFDIFKASVLELANDPAIQEITASEIRLNMAFINGKLEEFERAGVGASDERF